MIPEEVPVVLKDIILGILVLSSAATQQSLMWAMLRRIESYFEYMKPCIDVFLSNSLIIYVVHINVRK